MHNRTIFGRTAMAAAFVAGVLQAGLTHAQAIPPQGLVPVQAVSGTSWSQPAFGPTVTGTLASGTSSYFGTDVTGTASGSGGGAQLGTWATVTQDTGSPVVLGMAWRTRTLNESFVAEPGGHPTMPPLDLDNLFFGLTSDVLSLNGLDGKTFVLQMSYVENPAWFNEATEASLGCLQIQWYNPAIQLWVDSTLGNSQNASGRLINYQGSWAAAGSPLTLGSWGVDTTSNIVWAVLDHNSEFAVAPEPATIGLLATGIVGMMLVVRRRRNGTGEGVAESHSAARG